MFPKKTEDDPNFPRCKACRGYLIKKMGQTRDGRSYWQCPSCKKVEAI